MFDFLFCIFFLFVKKVTLVFELFRKASLLVFFLPSSLLIFHWCVFFSFFQNFLFLFFLTQTTNQQAFSCYLVLGHILLNTAARNNVELPSFIRTLSVTAQFTMVYFAPTLRGPGDGAAGAAAVAAAGAAAAAAAAAGAGGVQNQVTAPSERERIIAQFGTQVLNVPPREEGGGGGDVAAAAAAPPAAAPPAAAPPAAAPPAAAPPAAAPPPAGGE